MSTAAALTQLQKDIQKKKLPSLLDRKFEKVAGCDNEEGDFSVMQWNVLAQGRVIFVIFNILCYHRNQNINSMSVMLKIFQKKKNTQKFAPIDIKPFILYLIVYFSRNILSF